VVDASRPQAVQCVKELFPIYVSSLQNRVPLNA